MAVMNPRVTCMLFGHNVDKAIIEYTFRGKKRYKFKQKCSCCGKIQIDKV